MSTTYQMARKLAALGRNGDSTLMHVQPHEIVAIARLLGKPVTINPITGLPEAFSWGKLLAGIGLGIAALASGGVAIPGLTALAGLGSTGAAILGATGASLASGAFAPNGSNNQSQADALLAKKAQEAKAQWKIPIVQVSSPATGYSGLPGVSPEQDVQPIRTPIGTVDLNGLTTIGKPPGFAGGGHIPEQDQAQQVVVDAVQALQGQSQDSQRALLRFIQVFGEDKLQQLVQLVASKGGAAQESEQNMKRGGLLRGPGGGMDDLMTARVADGSMVALSGGEHIVPADVVAHIGDGNNEQGSRALDAMAAAIRMKKTGSTKQPAKLAE